MKIVGKTYAVQLQPDSTGNVSVVTHRIVIPKDGPEDERREVLLHEMIEILNREMDLQLSHQTIASLSVGLFSCDAVQIVPQW